jgi:AP endonuclease-2
LDDATKAETTGTHAGYSGVAIYTRNSVCAPIRAEEGITGILTPPNSSTSFRDLPEDQQIGGYPTVTQLADCPPPLDNIATLDSEGRCVVLEFPAFVLIGVYCPANTDESRDEFRLSFINALDYRVRNLVAAGKRVLLTGDLNIIREEVDTANAEEQMKKHGMTARQEYVSTPARRMLNQLLVGGKVFGERDEGREKPVMWDICRSFHPDRKGMFTCWQQKINARPANFGSRIDYVLCSEEWKDWFCESNIQEGLMGSDHCPVYAVLKQEVDIDGKVVDIRDIMSAGMFKGGIRQREWSARDLLPTSAKLIPEFDRRQSIRDMFTKKPSLKAGESTFSNNSKAENDERTQIGSAAISLNENTDFQPTIMASPAQQGTKRTTEASSSTAQPSTKRTAEPSSIVRPPKKGKSGAGSKSAAPAKGQPEKGQSSLQGFFKSKVSQSDGPADVQPSQEYVVDPIVAKESWSKLLGKRTAPRCEHNELCIILTTKKPGANLGRSFFMCPRPIGPSGQKEKNTEWRCGTFIWSSDWNGDDRA